MQRVTVDRMPSSVKKARGGAICMGVSDDKEAGRILSESTIEAGASPGSLGNRMPGALYAELPGIPEEDWSRMARTYAPPTPEALAAAVAPFVPAPSPRPRHAAPATRPAAPAARRSEVGLLGEEGELIDDGHGGPDQEQLDERDDDPQARPEPRDPETPLDDDDPRAPIRVPTTPRMQFVDDSDRWTKSDLMDLLRRTLLDAHAAGRTRIKPADLAPVVAHVGPENLKPPRLSGYLSELCQPGPSRLLRRDRDTGWYIIEPSEQAGQPVLAGAGV